jgi:hypothetical protein
MNSQAIESLQAFFLTQSPLLVLVWPTWELGGPRQSRDERCLAAAILRHFHAMGQWAPAAYVLRRIETAHP